MFSKTAVRFDRSTHGGFWFYHKHLLFVLLINYVNECYNVLGYTANHNYYFWLSGICRILSYIFTLAYCHEI